MKATEYQQGALDRIRAIITEWRRGCSCATPDNPAECQACTEGALSAIEAVVKEEKPNLTLPVVQRKWKECRDKAEDLAAQNHELHTRWTETADDLDRLRYALKLELGGSPEHEASDGQLLAQVRRAVEAESTAGAMQGRIQDLEAALTNAGICPDCLEAPKHDIDEPFANCRCGTGEDHGRRPMQRLQFLEGFLRDWAELKGVPIDLVHRYQQLMHPENRQFTRRLKADE